MERYPLPFRCRADIVKMSILSKLLYTFNAVSIKIRITYLAELEKTTLKFIWNQKRSRIKKNILKNQRKAEGSTIPDTMLYDRTAMLKENRTAPRINKQTNKSVDL